MKQPVAQGIVIIAGAVLIPLATPAQEVARLQILPASRSVAVGDSLPLQVRALDARGNVVPTATIRFTAQGGRFQGGVDSLGVVRGVVARTTIGTLATSGFADCAFSHRARSARSTTGSRRIAAGRVPEIAS